MRKILTIAFLILFTALAVIFLFNSRQEAPVATSTVTKVGVMGSGNFHDQNFYQAHFDALESIKKNLNLEMVYKEYVNAADCAEIVEQLVEQDGCQIVIGASVDYSDVMENVAADYPEITFFQLSGIKPLHNLSTFFGRVYQARYLSGIVAGRQSKTGHIGFVASYPIPEVIRGINAFALGVHSVRSDATVHVRYFGSWIDDKKAGEATNYLLDKYPIDVITVHSNSNEPYKIAEERGVWSIGCNRDNAALFPKTYLLACVFRWELYYYKQLLSCLQGKFHGSQDWLDMVQGIVTLSPFNEVIDARSRELVAEASDRLQGFDFDVFYGPIMDNTGQIRVEAGEAMTDDEMWQGFDWYVGGVKIED
ncbi:MAG: BMP family ABC transporter substrate-binding protein [Succinivibrio sp.]|nr:BMP family ABC transporter substrate-binding protein [Succinivibrio sp.]